MDWKDPRRALPGFAPCGERPWRDTEVVGKLFRAPDRERVIGDSQHCSVFYLLIYLFLQTVG